MTYEITQTYRQLGHGPKYRLSVEIHTTQGAENDEQPIFTFTKICRNYDEANRLSETLSDMFIVMKYEAQK